MEIIAQYPYAFDEDNNLVPAGELVFGYQYTRGYRCPFCGQPMYPVEGYWCFSHGSGQCDLNSYISSTAKAILSQRLFNRKAPFKVGILSRRYCKFDSECTNDKRNCSNIPKKYSEFNLWEYYDLLVEELNTAISVGFSPYFRLKSSNPQRKDIYILVSNKSMPINPHSFEGYQVIEFVVNEVKDLNFFDERNVFKQGPKIRFHNFKDLPMTPEMIVDELSQIKRQDASNAVERGLPSCINGDTVSKASKNCKRYVLYEGGKFKCFELKKGDPSGHDPSAIMDITYYTNYFKGFDPGKILAQKDRRARFCNYCEYCKTSARDTTWCDIRQNGWTKHGTFDKLKGTTCPKFMWRRSIAAVDWDFGDIKPTAGKDYIIWKNPKLK
ncbi:MAG: hypothetical protein IJK44_08790 [Bacteroidales bacterium]|nr:hypothetical protein [Bacteroidales bacterium]